ncbi:Zinc finger DNA binding protein [Operophtera brumata]|uniref:Zinc finger DNA binding protein n=1 Tax=Operophtera brumata TaxID=104452 RepID=A0A0L7KTU7_OPEBR|nr:Zinc finger DNA binding protein [Operophtera brumata]
MNRYLASTLSYNEVQKGGPHEHPHWATEPKQSTRQSSISESAVDELKIYFETKLKEATATILSQVREQLTLENKSIHKEFEDVKASISYTNSQFEDLSRLVSEKTKIIENLKSENEELRTQVSIINVQLNNIEQHSRACNIEIQCVPESKTENLLTTVKQLGRVVSRDISDSEIIDFHRVPKLNQQTSRPRAIVVKLASPRIRDEILVAVKKFNRTPITEKLHSEHLGVAGSKQPVYVAEHLSPMNKKLHAAARVAVKEKQYQFLWVRNGKIFVRKNISSKAQLICSEDALKDL